MTTDQLTQLTTTALDTLADALDQGRSAALTALLRTMSRFHRYSLHNTWLIAAQRPDATLVAGFQTWKTMRRFVRRGEQGIAILAPIVRRRGQSDDEDERGVVGFRAAYVFDVSQTDGEPLPEPSQPAGEPGPAALDQLRAAIAGRGIALEYAEALGGALGLSSGGRIRVLSGLSAASEFGVLAHEFAHELLHHGDDRPESRNTRELEAEAVAFVVSSATGIEALASSVDYLQLYRGNREALAQSLERIQRTASTILRAMDGA
jgi:hypothetical protein